MYFRVRVDRERVNAGGGGRRLTLMLYFEAWTIGGEVMDKGGEDLD